MNAPSVFLGLILPSSTLPAATAEADGAEERLEVLEESAGRLVLRNADEARNQAVGIDRLKLERCPDT